MSGLFSPSNNALPSLLALLGSPRTRQEWNERFTHWERPASISEAGTIERAQSNVLAALSNNQWLVRERISIFQQGSYYNNTNVRTEADIDLRAVHPSVKVDYADNVYEESAQAVLGYINYGLTFDQIFSHMHTELMADLGRRFGQENIVAGQKALRIKGITGSRAEVDVVPAIRLHHIFWRSDLLQYEILEGIAILARDGRWTLNFPEQHHNNGIAKRARTAHRFKKIVRIFKRLRSDMKERGVLHGTVPSFLIECLVYLVEDAYFMVDADDRYARVRRVAQRLQARLRDPQAVPLMTEINGMVIPPFLAIARSRQTMRPWPAAVLG
ncbi:hypothetical protein ACWKWV_06345 [Castellaniella ginsengisoli]